MYWPGKLNEHYACSETEHAYNYLKRQISGMFLRCSIEYSANVPG